LEHICEIWVRDRKGRIRAYRKIKRALLTRQFGALFASIMKLYAYQYMEPTTYVVVSRDGLTGQYLGGVGVTPSITVESNSGYSGSIGVFSYTRLRVVAGVAASPTTPSITDYNLNQTYAEANCGPVAYAEDVSTNKIRVSVQGNISFSEAKTVTEVGLALGVRNTAGTLKDFLLARDVPSPPVSVNVGQTLTIKYTWVFN
jgi:uncharacterized membrane protein